jgi:hypothetical protein
VLHEDIAVLRDAGGAGISEKLGELATEAGGGQLDIFDGGFGHRNGGEKGARVADSGGKASREAR